MSIIRMFCRKNQYLKIRKIHHTVLKFVFNSDNGYDELLQMSNEITIHQKHLHALICEVFKSLSNFNRKFMWSYFTFKNIPYNIRNVPLLKLPNAKSPYYGINYVDLGHAYCGMAFPSLLNILNISLSWKRNSKNWKMLTVLVFYVDEIINKIVFVFCWFLLAFVICKHQRKIKL